MRATARDYAEGGNLLVGLHGLGQLIDRDVQRDGLDLPGQRQAV
jgi:hypothetical protein